MNQEGLERLSKIVPKWASDAIILGMIVQTNPEIAYIVQLLAKANEWVTKLSAATQQSPDQIADFMADNYKVTVPPYEIGNFIILKTRTIIQQVEQFNWTAEKLYNYYLREGELPKKGDPFVIAYRKYTPIDWVKLTEELEKAVRDDT